LYASSGTGTAATVVSDHGVGLVAIGSEATAAQVLTSSTGSPALEARIDNAANARGAVEASTSGTGAAIVGVSAKGRGGLFYGKAASLRLYPGATATHPAAGARGDLYVDTSGRLWYCKTTGNPATWTQLA
jgi:hypothetical protein